MNDPDVRGVGAERRDPAVPICVLDATAAAAAAPYRARSR